MAKHHGRGVQWPNLIETAVGLEIAPFLPMWDPQAKCHLKAYALSEDVWLSSSKTPGLFPPWEMAVRRACRSLGWAAGSRQSRPWCPPGMASAFGSTLSASLTAFGKDVALCIDFWWSNWDC